MVDRDSDLRIQARLVDYASPAIDALVAKTQAAAAAISGSLAAATKPGAGSVAPGGAVASGAVVADPKIDVGPASAALSQLETQVARLVVAIESVRLPASLVPQAVAASQAVDDLAKRATVASAALASTAAPIQGATASAAALGTATVTAGDVGSAAMVELRTALLGVQAAERALQVQTAALTADLTAAGQRVAALEAQVVQLKAAGAPTGGGGAGAGALGFLGIGAGALIGLTAVTVGVGLLISKMGQLGQAFDGTEDRAKEFDLELKQIATIANLTTGQLEELRVGIAKVAVEQGTLPTEAAQGFYLAVSSGVEASTKGLEFFSEANKLAVATLATSKQAVDVLTSAINAYGFEVTEAARLSDVLFKTVEKGKALLPELAASLGQVFPIAAQLGVSFEEVAAAVATLTQSGRSVSEATTEVRAGLVALQKRGEDIRAVFNKVGLQFDSTTVRTLGLHGTFQLLRDTVGDNTETLTGLLGRVEALNLALGITGKNADRFKDSLAAVSERGGVDRAFKLIQESDIKRQEKALNELRTTIDLTLGSFSSGFKAELFSGFIDELDLSVEKAAKLGQVLRGVGVVLAEGVLQLVRDVRDLNATLSAATSGLVSFQGAFALVIASFDKLTREAQFSIKAIDAVVNAVVDFDNWVLRLAYSIAGNIVTLISEGIGEGLKLLESAATGVADALRVLVPGAAAGADVAARLFKNLQGVAAAGEEAGKRIAASAPQIGKALKDGVGAKDLGKEAGDEFASAFIEGTLRAAVEAARFQLEIEAKARAVVPITFDVADSDLNEAQRSVRAAIQELEIAVADAGGAEIPLPITKALTDLRALTADPIRFAFLDELDDELKGKVSLLDRFTGGVRSAIEDLSRLTASAATTPAERAAEQVKQLQRGIESSLRELGRIGIPQAQLDAIRAALGGAVDRINKDATDSADKAAAAILRTREDVRDAVLDLESEITGGSDAELRGIDKRVDEVVQRLVEFKRERQDALDVKPGEIAALDELIQRTVDAGTTLRQFASEDAANALRKSTRDLFAAVDDIEAGVGNDTERRLSRIDAKIQDSIQNVEEFRRERERAVGVTPEELASYDKLIARLIAAGANLKQIEIDDIAAKRVEALAEATRDLGDASAQALPTVYRDLAELTNGWGVVRAAAVQSAAEQIAALGLVGDAAEVLREKILAAADLSQVGKQRNIALDLVLTPRIEIEASLIEAEIEQRLGPALDSFANLYAGVLADGIITPSESARVQANLDDLRAALADVRSELVETDEAFAKGFSAELNDRIEATFNRMREGAELASSAFDAFGSNLGDAIASVALNLKSGTEALKDFVRGFIADLARAVSQIIAFKAAASLFGLFAGGGVPEVTPEGLNFAAGSTPIFAKGGVFPGEMQSATAFANGGIMPGMMSLTAGAQVPNLPVVNYAMGGVATTPQMAIFAEKPNMAEAFVPLPGPGRGIPVEFKGGGGGGGTTIHVNYAPVVQALDGASAREVLTRESRAIADIVANEISLGSHKALRIATQGARGHRS